MPDSHEGTSGASTGESLATVFTAVAAQHGGRLALNDQREGPPLTYEQVYRAATNLAAELPFNGSSPPEVIAIFLPTSAHHVIAVLGVIMANQVWLSLDPAYPDERLELMLREATPPLIITSLELEARASTLYPAARILSWVPVTTQPPQPLNLFRTNPWRPCCIFFTSGSTGHPKSAVHTHANILFDIRRQTRDLAITPGDRFDLLFSASFSAFLSPVFGALLTGASVHLWPLFMRPMSDLRDWLEDTKITVSTMSVSSFRRLAATPIRHGFEHLRILSMGAEPLVPADYEAFSRRFPPQCILQNALATTETRTIAQECHAASSAPPERVTCGWPVERKTIELWDPEGMPVAAGKPGEIVVISDVIAPADWPTFRALPHRTFGRPHLTVHHTGDVGKFLPDGRLVHLGRLDSQLKIRGHRVEALEVENELLRHQSISQAAVCLTPGPDDTSRLTAMFIATSKTQPVPEALRELLRHTLPDYAIPSLFIQVESLPTTPSGKLDRQALPEFARQYREAGVPAAPTIADHRTILAQILDQWSIALNFRLKADDDFFSHGGDSLQAVETMAALQSELGRNLSPGLMVEYPTARKLAEYLETTSEDPIQTVSIRQLRAGNSDLAPVYFLPPWNHGSTLFRDLAKAPSSTNANPWFALEVFNSAPTPPESIPQLAALYLPILQRRHPTDPFCLVGYSAAGLIAWEITQQLVAQGRDNVSLILLDSSRTFSKLSPAELIEERRSKRPAVKVMRLMSYAINPRGLHRLDFIRNLLFEKLSWWTYRRFRQEPVDPYAKAFATNIELSANYLVKPLAVPVAVIRARHQNSWLTRFQADLGWTPFCLGPLLIKEVNCSHLNLLYAPKAHTTARTIEQLTAQLITRRTPAPPPPTIPRLG